MANEERDMRIRAAVGAGESPKVVAEREGVSVSTVRRAAIAAATPKKATKAEVKPEPKAAPEPAPEAEKAPRKIGGAADRTELTLEDVLGWNERWTDADRAFVKDGLKDAGAVRYLLPKSGAYIRCENRDGEHVIEVAKKRLRIPPNQHPEGDVDGDGFKNLPVPSAG